MNGTMCILLLISTSFVVIPLRGKVCGLRLVNSQPTQRHHPHPHSFSTCDLCARSQLALPPPSPHHSYLTNCCFLATDFSFFHCAHSDLKKINLLLNMIAYPLPLPLPMISIFKTDRFNLSRNLIVRHKFQKWRGQAKDQNCTRDRPHGL